MLRGRARAVDSECKARVEKAFAEAAERAARAEKLWKEQVDTAYAHVCSRMLTYAHVCSRMLTYAQVCR
jgi:CO dehydrogenase/acetyl-CoA synthase beta subunit